jgi:hypothetical protein
MNLREYTGRKLRMLMRNIKRKNLDRSNMYVVTHPASDIEA